MFYRFFSFLNRIYNNVKSFIYKCFDYHEPFERKYNITNKEREDLYNVFSGSVREKYNIEILPSLDIRLTKKGLEGRV